MPEGLEVYVLAKVLKNLGIQSESCGKHLLVKDPHSGSFLDITFGLYGKININKELKISKICIEGKPCGDVNEIQNFDEVRSKLGVDWVSATKTEIEQTIKKWGLRKKKISSLLVDQKEIAGIGSYWVSKILLHAMVSPDTHAHTLGFLGLVEPLAKSIIQVRDEALSLYLNSISKDEMKFVNEWCENLYKQRKYR